jgi:formylglycine-generating enzyme required for sulfatase activity
MGRDDPHPSSKLQTTPPGSDDPIPPALAASSEHEVIREISRGGMGVVYLARNRRMDRLEALKVVKGVLLEQAGSLERFEREMRAAARLNHSNIVTAYSSPSLDGLLTFAMEFVDGTDLYELVNARGPLPVSNACYYVYQTAQGLQHACDRQMVHRDIKPNNLMLTRDGKKQVIKILDFGLAKATSENPTGAGLTRTGQMMGTPMYMAPEQIADAARADIRADIYGLGCTMYYLLTGHPPFADKGSLYAILHAHQSEIARPLDELRPEVPAELAQIVAKMMAKDAAQRYQQPSEVAQALAPFFKQGVKPIPTGTARFAAPSAAQIPAETASSKAAAATPLLSPAAVPVAAARVQNTAHPPVGRDLDEPNSMQTVLAVVAEPPRPAAVSRSGRDSPRQTPSKIIRPKIWLGVAVAFMLLAGLGLWASGILTAKLKTGNGTSTTGAAAAETPAGDVAARKPSAPESFAEETASSQTLENQTLKNSIGMELVLISAGKFQMGSPASEQGRSSDEAQVDVTLTKSFYLGKTEVTQGQWRAVMGTTPWKGRTIAKEGDSYVATYVSWNDAQAFCKKLSDNENATYRLPSEAEWEYACRGGMETRFSFGDDDSQLGNFAWYEKNVLEIGEKHSHKVGSKQGNPFGLYDLHGNIWEWCQDIYADKLPGGIDPLVSSEGSFRVNRGGGWGSNAARCRSASRSKFLPSNSRNDLGIRVARSSSN